MNSRFDRRQLLLAAVFALTALTPDARLVAQTHAGAVLPVQDFDAAVWTRLLQEGPRPAAYVYTTTYCSTCPAVFEQLHAHITARRMTVELAGVIMDEQGERALRHAHHYRGMTRLYAFKGFEPEIRHAVDPKWRNITPYVVLIDRQGRQQRLVGAPTQAQLRAWL